MSFDLVGLGFMALLGMSVFWLLDSTKPKVVDDDEDDEDWDDEEDYRPVKRQIQPVKPPRKKRGKQKRRLPDDYWN